MKVIVELKTNLQSMVALVLSITQLATVRGDFKLEVQFHSYSNPSHASVINNGCCDGGNRLPPDCSNQCDTYLIICLRNISNDGIPVPAGPSDCPYGFVRTDLLEDGRTSDDVMFGFNEPLDISGMITNPLQFVSDEPWMESIQVILESFDEDNGNDDFIDVRFISLRSPFLSLQSDGYTYQTNYTGIYGLSQFFLSFRISCADNYYGSDCTTYCTGRNDSLGYYYCDDEGDIVCRQGYRNLLTNCTECQPSQGCLLTGGYCTVPYECLCYDGYTGTNCSQIVIDESLNSELMTSAIAGSVVGVLLLLILSMIVVVAVVAIISKRRRSISSVSRSKAGRNRGFQENASYIDLINKDALTRSTELTISDTGIQNRIVESDFPNGQIQRLSTTETSMSDLEQDDPNYTQVQFPLRERTDTDLPPVQLNRNPSYSQGNIYSIDDGQTMTPSPHRNQINSQDSNDLDQNEEETIQLKRNNSYRILDIGEIDSNTAAGEHGEVVYSYPKLHNTTTRLQSDYCTNSSAENSSVPSADPYSKIELKDMYENLQAVEDNMVENGVYGEFEEGEAAEGIWDPYANEGMGPK